MVALVKGQNAPLAADRIRITIEVDASAEVSALLVTPAGRVRDDGDFAFHGRPRADGVAWVQAGQRQEVTIDLGAVPAGVDRVLTVVSLDDRAFGAVPAPSARIFDPNGNEVGSFLIDGLRDERALIAFEVYRRGGGWKYRAVGQGYSGGLAQLVAAHGVSAPPAARVAAGSPVGGRGITPPPPPVQAAPAAPPPGQTWPSSVPPATIPAMSIRPPSVPVEETPPGPPGGFGTRAEERMYDVLWKIFEDAARATASLRSATEYAEKRRDSEMSALLDDPRMRNSPHTDQARAEAERKHDQLIAQATADYKRDVNALVSELHQLSPQLPAPMAGWESPSWHSWAPPAEEPAVAIRIGDLTVAEAPELRVPMVFRLPMRMPLWIDSSEGRRTEAAALARTLVVRLLAAYPPGQLKVHVADLVGGGAAAQALQPLNPGVLFPAATTPQQLSEMLGKLTERVDLIQMAAQNDALETLEGTVDSARQLLVLHDFPYGFDDRAVAQLRFLIEEGPSTGVHILFVADPGDASTLGPLVSSLWRSMLRLSAVPDDHIGDPWVGLNWTYTPDGASSAPAVDSVLARLAARI
jgi:stress response protein SCP2